MAINVAYYFGSEIVPSLWLGLLRISKYAAGPFVVGCYGLTIS